MSVHRYKLDYDRSPESLGGIDRYVVVCGGTPVIEYRSNGSPTWLTYKSLSMARRGVQRCKTEGGLDAQIFDKETP